MNDTPNTGASTPYATVADIIAKQNEIERRLSAIEQTHREIADQIDALAGKITYLTTSPSEVRAGLHEIAAVLRGEKRAEEVRR